MTDSLSSLDTSSHIDRLIQLGRQAVRDAQQRSRELGVANVYSLNGRIYYEMPNGELSLNAPEPKVPPANTSEMTGNQDNA